VARVQGDEFYLGLLDELSELHVVKSSTYGAPGDALANFTRIAHFTGEPAWRYPRRRALEKLARIEELERLGRLDAIEEEHVDAASLLVCAEALRRRHVLGPALHPLGERGRAIFVERLRELADTVDVVGLSTSASACDVDRDAAERELVAALKTAAELLGPAASDALPTPGSGAQKDVRLHPTERSCA
jgi:hypothetical protein